MKKITTSLEHWFSNKFPSLYLKFIQQPRSYFRFKTERKLSRGIPLSRSNHPSILFFTTQKCASRYVNQIISRLSSTAGMVHADYDAYVTMVRMPQQLRPFASEENSRIAFHPRGYYYGPIGTSRNIPDMESYRVVLQLRDPRDVLTSLYFSTAFSHAIINPKMVRRRRQALEMDIDAYVLHEVDEYLPIFSQYCDMLLMRDPVLFLRYEEMVADFPGWLDRLAIHVGLDKEAEILQEIRKEADFSVKKEDERSQRRQITPGDHLRKLKPETIRQLNERFESVLKRLDYKL